MSYTNLGKIKERANNLGSINTDISDSKTSDYNRRLDYDHLLYISVVMPPRNSILTNNNNSNGNNNIGQQSTSEVSSNAGGILINAVAALGYNRPSSQVRRTASFDKISKDYF
ncbi:5729_t:CDS:2 [Ambispora leptoticha]|uniref:5729_t:CDS:1 n=1 Tax=Ambispora leptoticha TaxID=144679 RepID=A0A9N9DN12_9GLOM|nr:5729_t:CDS:2 [Ambispora leptoticha]